MYPDIVKRSSSENLIADSSRALTSDDFSGKSHHTKIAGPMRNALYVLKLFFVELQTNIYYKIYQYQSLY